MEERNAQETDPVSRVGSETLKQKRKPRRNNKFKILCFWLLLFAATICFLETASYIIIKRTVPSRILLRANGYNSNSLITDSSQFKERHRVVKASALTNELNSFTLFHSVLGWDYPPGLVYGNSAGVTFSHGPGGERRCLTNYETALISTYGDSFTYCDEVGDQDTWQTSLGDKLKTNVLNFGVCGYGPDQALLKYELNRRLHTKVVILGILPENINRVVNIYRPFYTISDSTMLTKPMFIKRGGTIRLIPNPISSVANLPKLDQESFMEELGKVDYWYQLDMRLPKFSLPYTFSLYEWKDVMLSHLVAGVNELRKKEACHPWNLYDEDYPLSIMCYIADRFINDARARGSEPLIVIMPHKDNIIEVKDRGVNRVARFVQYLSRKGYPFFDGVQCLADMNPSKRDLEKWYGSHASAEGNRILAEILSKVLTAKYSCFSGSPGPGGTDAHSFTSGVSFNKVAGSGFGNTE